MLKMYRNTKIHVQTLNGTFHKDSNVFSDACFERAGVCLCAFCLMTSMFSFFLPLR